MKVKNPNQKIRVNYVTRPYGLYQIMDFIPKLIHYINGAFTEPITHFVPISKGRLFFTL